MSHPVPGYDYDDDYNGPEDEYFRDMEDDGEYDDDMYDGQPDEYTEWQDYMGGDDWDHGQFDCFDCGYF